MSTRSFFIALLQLALAGTVLLLSHYNYTWLAALLVLVPLGYNWVKGGRTWHALLMASPVAIIGLSIVVLIGLNRPPIGRPVFPVATQLVFTLFYGFSLIKLRQLQIQERSSLALLGIQQVLAVMAIFLAAAFWHWPEAVVVAMVWVVVTLTTMRHLRVIGERAAAIVATAWGLVASQVAWVLSIWQVNYIIQDGLLIIPQASLVILGLGYCFASIYSTHRDKKLSRRRLIEYVAIAGVLLAIVIAGTRWNGTA